MAETALPLVLQEIAEAAGLEAAWALARAKGGQSVFIPAHARPGHWLTDVVGLDAATKICDYYRVQGAGTKLLIPMASAAQRAAQWQKVLAEGRTANETAATLGVHRRTVFRHLAKSSKDDQGELF